MKNAKEGYFDRMLIHFGLGEYGPSIKNGSKTVANITYDAACITASAAYAAAACIIPVVGMAAIATVKFTANNVGLAVLRAIDSCRKEKVTKKTR